MGKLKRSDIKVGMTVKCQNMFNLSYTVDKIQANGKFTLSHWGGESKRMFGGKWSHLSLKVV